MDYPQIKNIDELPAILEIHPSSLKRWFKNYPFGSHSDSHSIRNKVLVGKPVIAAFLGISIKTLKRWFVKHHTIPIIRRQYRCYAVTNHLMLWKVARELDKLQPSCFDAVRARMIADTARIARVTEKHFIETYVTMSRYKVDDPVQHVRIKRTGHYRKTVDKTVKLLDLFESLRNTTVSEEVP